MYFSTLTVYGGCCFLPMKTVGGSAQHLPLGAKNSSQDCFSNAPTVNKEIKILPAFCGHFLLFKISLKYSKILVEIFNKQW